MAVEGAAENTKLAFFDSFVMQSELVSLKDLSATATTAQADASPPCHKTLLKCPLCALIEEAAGLTTGEPGFTLW